ncbi:CD276 antigen-like isoform X1 [Leucoraja erinacea]|uniref:CD276 antigen-like isoform X1 n=1 Tax=Leucoraja erinaceus TaxID=7782 RepID=UPI002457F243|nr:CD276 antigen-like isoform X1 [Leucoraja erinacea]
MGTDFRVTRRVAGLLQCALLLLCCRTVSPSSLTVTGIVGESALLPCLDTNVGKQANNDIRVYWQVATRLIHSFHKGREDNTLGLGTRARLFTAEFKHGNFSLLLTDLRVSDAATYTCLIQLKLPTEGNSVVLRVTVTLQIAAHFAKPTLSTHLSEEQQGAGGVLRLTCSSWGGYPAPAVGWTCGSLNLDPNSTATTHTDCSPQRLCNVTSFLWVSAGVHCITCSIHNTRLKEKQTETFTAMSPSSLTVTGIVGESALLPCLDTNVGKQANNDIRVYWQVATRLIHSFHKGREDNTLGLGTRARLFTAEFKHGNFSLLLTDLRVSDAATYTCLIQLKLPTEGNSVVLRVTVTLQIAENTKGMVVSKRAKRFWWVELIAIAAMIVLLLLCLSLRNVLLNGECFKLYNLAKLDIRAG